MGQLQIVPSDLVKVTDRRIKKIYIKVSDDYFTHPLTVEVIYEANNSFSVCFVSVSFCVFYHLHLVFGGFGLFVRENMQFEASPLCPR